MIKQTQELNHRQKQLLEKEIIELASKKRNTIESDKRTNDEKIEKMMVERITKLAEPIIKELKSALTGYNKYKSLKDKLEKQYCLTTHEKYSGSGYQDGDVKGVEFGLKYNWKNEFQNDRIGKDVKELANKREKVLDEIKQTEKELIAEVWGMSRGDYRELLNKIVLEFAKISL